MQDWTELALDARTLESRLRALIERDYPDSQRPVTIDIALLGIQLVAAGVTGNFSAVCEIQAAYEDAMATEFAAVRKYIAGEQPEL